MSDNIFKTEIANLPCIDEDDVLCGPLPFTVTKVTDKEKEQAVLDLQKNWPGFEVIDMAHCRGKANVLKGLLLVDIDMMDMSDITFWLVAAYPRHVRENMKDAVKKSYLVIFNKREPEVEFLQVVPEELVPLIGIGFALCSESPIEKNAEEV